MGRRRKQEADRFIEGSCVIGNHMYDYAANSKDVSGIEQA
jgi:hypothetical protein